MVARSCSTVAVLILGITLSTASTAAPKRAPAADEIVDLPPFHPPPGQPREIARIDLSKPFHIPRDANLTATQWPPQKEDLDFEADASRIGLLRVCIHTKSTGPCSPEFRDYRFDIAELVYPEGRSAPPLIHLQIAGLNAGSSSRSHSVILAAYRRGRSRFQTIFDDEFGGNMNHDIRYIAAGPLHGDVISAEPTWNAPFGYWIAVNKLTPSYHYRQVLRYRSATHYGDGNRLAVIDSEMPNILRRLGLWHPGGPLPVPKSGCVHPRLVKTELWCS